MKRTAVILLLVVAAVLAGIGWWYLEPIYRIQRAQRAFASHDLARADALLRPLAGDSRAHALYAKVLRRRAEEDVKAHRWDEADDCYTRWLLLEPDKLDTRLARAHARLEAARDGRGSVDGAVADFRTVLDQVPNRFDARLSLAEALLSDARMTEAHTELVICHQLRPRRLEPLLGLASCAVEERHWDEARSLLGEALAIDPHAVLALTMEGDICLRTARYADAARFFKRALAVDARNKSAHLKLAQALRDGGQLDEAKREEKRYEEIERRRE
jgi:predicted Zn-dependent protease